MKHAKFGPVVVLLMWLSAAQQGAAGHSVSGRSAVPKMATLAGFTAGYDTIEEMERRFGHGLEYTGGHPRGAREWETKTSPWAINADGFNYRSDGGRVIDSLSISRYSDSPDSSVPVIKRPLRKKLWMGVVSLGMTKDQVLTVLRGKLPSPKVSGDTLIWKIHKIVRINDNQYEDEHDWTSQLMFVGGRLDTISVSVD